MQVTYDATVYKILGELAGEPERERRRILTTQDAALTEQNTSDVAARLRLDKALDALTLIEIALQSGLLFPYPLDEAVSGDAEPAMVIDNPVPSWETNEVAQVPTAFVRLACDSEAFLRYADTYLYFGVRMLAGRIFSGYRYTAAPGNPGSATPAAIENGHGHDAGSIDAGSIEAGSIEAAIEADRRDDSFNRRLMPVPYPPVLPPAGPNGNLEWEAIFERFLRLQAGDDASEGLGFLDGFGGGLEESDHPLSEEPMRFELWLRGLYPVSLEDSTESDRFQRLTDSLVRWVAGRVDFYRSLQQLPPPQANKIRDGKPMPIVNPATARFALNDIYWLARLLQAEVSTNASVSARDRSWLQLIRFSAVLDATRSQGYSADVSKLIKKQEADTLAAAMIDADGVLRAVFDYACDLVQNAIWLAEDAEKRMATPAVANARDLRRAALALLRQPVTSLKQVCGMTSATPGNLLRAAAEFARCPLEKLTMLSLAGPATPSAVRDAAFLRRWHEVFDEELQQIDRQRRQRTYGSSSYGNVDTSPPDHGGDYWSVRVRTGRQPEELIGLALSGGGVRSATFNLGLLQGLQERDLLRHVDYLSTVSGGGFIGGWLVGNVLRARHWLGKATSWDESIAHLREYSSYLAPLTTIFSADTWTLGASWIRNTLLIQLSALAWLLMTLLAVYPAYHLFTAVGPDALWLMTVWNWPAFLASHAWFNAIFPPLNALAVISIFMGAIVTLSIIYNFDRDRAQTGSFAFPARWVTYLAVIPSWVGAFFVAKVLWDFTLKSNWTWDETGADPKSYSTILCVLWQRLPLLCWVPVVCLLIICSFALQPAGLETFKARKQRKWQRRWQALWIGFLCGAALYLANAGIVYLFARLDIAGNIFGAAAFVFGPALVLMAFSLSVLLLIGLSGKYSEEPQREWWTRYGALLTIFATLGLLLSAAPVFAPYLLLLVHIKLHSWLGLIKWGAVVAWLGTVLGGIVAGNSSKSAAQSSSGKWMELLAKAGGLLFVIGAVVGASALCFVFLRLFTPTGADLAADALRAQYWTVFSEAARGSTPLWTLLVITLCAVLFSWFFEINIFGLSQLYRNRLVRCYLGATRWTAGTRQPHPFTGFDFNDDLMLESMRNDPLEAGPDRRDFRGPFPIFNCTLNLAGSADLAVHSRHSDSFSLTPLYCGSNRAGIGYASTAAVHKDSDSGFAGGVQLGQAIAVSGAAASPNMGYNTSPLVAMLLTLFNVRLGWWFANPGQQSWKQRNLGLSVRYLFYELIGRADECRKYVNVSDGGHFENLGVYELIRRRCSVIIVGDSECDEVLQFGALGNLVRICATDFGAQIDIDVKSIQEQRDGASLAHCTLGVIRYDNGSQGALIYFKASITGDEDIGIAQYRASHPAFPHESTAEQFFTEEQFESYRKLGRHSVNSVLRNAQPGDTPLQVARMLRDTITPQRTSTEAFLRHTAALNSIWEECRKKPSLHAFLDELMLVRPPSAVDPAALNHVHRASDELSLGLELIQLMENVYKDLRLDDFWTHPDNRGWAILFMRWARCQRFQEIWEQTRRTYGIPFEYFCYTRLGLTRDRPIVRI